MTDYYVENAQKEIERRIERAETLAKGWRNIKRHKTKDGKDFKNLKLNFTKGAITQKAPDNIDINIYPQSNKGNYFDDWIDISRTVYSDSEEAEKYKDEGRLLERGEWLHPYINLTPDEIEQAIAERASYFEQEAETLKQFMANDFKEVADRIVGMREKAESYMKAQPDAVYYILRSILRKGRN